MAIRKVKTKSFKTEGEAEAWATKEKERAGPDSKLKWETNRTDDPRLPWDAVLFREVGI